MRCPICDQELPPLIALLAQTDVGSQCPHCWTRLHRLQAVSAKGTWEGEKVAAGRRARPLRPRAKGIEVTPSEKRAMVRHLRTQAEHIRRHGLTNFFEHSFACSRYGQTSKDREEDRCGDCPFRPFVAPEWREEAYPCQHITEEGWALAAEKPELAESCIAWLLRTATHLEAEAHRANGL